MRSEREKDQPRQMDTKTDEDLRRNTENTEKHQDRAEANTAVRTGTKRWSERRLRGTEGEKRVTLKRGPWPPQRAQKRALRRTAGSSSVGTQAHKAGPSTEAGGPGVRATEESSGQPPTKLDGGGGHIWEAKGR